MCRPIYEQNKCIGCGRTWNKHAMIDPGTDRAAKLPCRSVRRGGPCGGEEHEIVNNIDSLCDTCRRIAKGDGSGKGGGKGKSGRVSKRGRRGSTTAGASSSTKSWTTSIPQTILMTWWSPIAWRSTNRERSCNNIFHSLTSCFNDCTPTSPVPTTPEYTIMFEILTPEMRVWKDVCTTLPHLIRPHKERPSTWWWKAYWTVDTSHM